MSLIMTIPLSCSKNTQIILTLIANMVRPKKHLGQHFLTDRSIARRIVGALRCKPGEPVLEIGPGKGILTEALLEFDIRLIPVELDHESVKYLIRKWPELEGLLIEDDFLRLDLEQVCPGPFHVIGNFPYNISSQIFFKILGSRSMVSSVVCMLQKEVADRITSPPGSREYGILSVLLGAYFDMEKLFTVKPGSFFPPPKVTSGVIRLSRNRIKSLPCDEPLFFSIVKTVFNQRRKMIRNSIKSILLNLDGETQPLRKHTDERGVPEAEFELLRRRPEELGVPEFIELTRWVKSQQSETA
jgi:16S rRNA (adenine1518-N6/adenine1519-N6)-dimethyltransferase